MKSPISTIEQHILERQQSHPTATGEFSWLLSGITLATRIIAAHVCSRGISIRYEGNYRGSEPCRRTPSNLVLFDSQ